MTSKLLASMSPFHFKCLSPSNFPPFPPALLIAQNLPDVMIKAFAWLASWVIVLSLIASFFYAVWISR